VTTAPPIDLPPRGPLSRADAQALIGRAAGPLLATRAEHVAAGFVDQYDIPPLRDGAFDRRAFVVWALRMGWHTGVNVIGNLGLAYLSGRRPATYRTLGHRRSGAPDDLPTPRWVIPRTAAGGREVVLYDRDEAIEWLVQTGKLAPDKVTPRRRRQPGAGRRRLAA
jgi:hypothetical protein